MRAIPEQDQLACHKYDCSAFTGWREVRLGYRYFIQDEWTGMSIIQINTVGIPKKPIIPVELFSIKPPTFRITFYPCCKFKDGYNIVGVSTLGRAKRIAESYYKKWLEVNKGGGL